MKYFLGISVSVSAALSCGCIAIGGYYVPSDFDSENSNWICLNNRPYYTTDLADEATLSVYTRQSGSTTYIYIIVSLQQDSTIRLVESHANIALSSPERVQVKLVRQSWQSAEYEARYGDNYQYFTIGTNRVAGEIGFILHLPNILALGKELVVEPIRFEKRSRILVDVCPSGMAW